MIFVSADQLPNAFVFGRTIGTSELVVTHGLLRELNQDEIRAVLAHEIGHLRHRDVIIMTLVSAIPILAYVAARLGFEALRYGRPRGKNAGGAIAAALFVAIMSYAVYLVTQLLVLHLSRTRESYADAYSGAATKDPHQLASALTQMWRGVGTPACRASSCTVPYSHGFDCGVTGWRPRTAHRTMAGEIAHWRRMNRTANPTKRRRA